MKKTILLLVIALIGLSLFAQQSLYTIKESSFEKVKIHFNIPDLQSSQKRVNDVSYSLLEMNGFFSTSTVGNPQLPVLSKTIEIPLCEDIQIKILSAAYNIYSTEELNIYHEIFPAQMSYSKSYAGTIDFFKSTDVYQKDEFYGESLARVEKVGIMRNINMANIYISPVQYNPVTRQIKIYSDIEVEISYQNADIPSTYEMKSLHTNGLFLGAQSMLVVNPIAPIRRDAITSAPVKYLIVSHSMFRGYLDEFIEWKKRKGFLVETGYTDDSNVGTTTTTIKNFIKSKYTEATPENPAPSYVLLVGDVQQIPAFSYPGHVSDLDYFLWTSGDSIPDCYYGRFSAQNIAQLIPQIEKTLQLEQYTMPDPSYLGKAVLVAGTDNYWSVTHANGQINYLSNYYINKAYGYTTIGKYLYPANSQAEAIRSELNAGVGYACYTAHCKPSGWSGPAFERSHISAMKNVDKYGLFIGNCCESAKFDDNECFGEAIVRASKKGAAAYIGGANDTYWNEDFYWSVGVRSSIDANPTYDATNLGAYDRLFHTHGEPFADWFTSAGAIIAAGNMAVQSSTSSRKNYYWQIYNLLGDPSLIPYLSIPKKINITCASTLLAGTTSMKIHAVPYAYIALTLENELITAAFANSAGIVTLNFAPLIKSDQYEIAVSAQNHVTAFKTINVIGLSEPYPVASSFSLNENSVPQFDTNIQFDLNVKNIGTQAVSNVYAKLHTTSPYVNITEDSLFIGNLATNQELIFTQVFNANISFCFPDETPACFFVTIYFDGNSSQEKLDITLLAPKFARAGFTLQEIEGNGDGVINPGETFKLTLLDKNAGHARVKNVQSSLISRHTRITIEDGNKLIPEIEVNQSTETSFIIRFDDSVEEGETYRLYYRIKKESYLLYDTLLLTIGKVMEDFESENFMIFPWINLTMHPWFITNEGAYEGQYCARSKQNLPDSATSELKITMNVSFDNKISYYRKVSSKNSDDLFKFFIDDKEKER